MKLKLIIILLSGAIFSSCNSTTLISNGGFSDVSLNVDSDKFEIKRLDELNYGGTAFWGIPQETQNTKGIVVRFNGIELGRNGRLAPILSLIGYNAIFTTTIYSSLYSQGVDAPLFWSLLISMPISGALNNFAWSNSAMQSASWNVNQNLLLYNPDVDVFLNPKYEVKSSFTLWKQEAWIKANVMGATLKAD